MSDQSPPPVGPGARAGRGGRSVAVMANQQLQRLAQIKLAELHRQRQSLTERYDALEQAARAGAAPLADRLGALLDGLAALSFARTRLHPTTDELRRQLRAPLLEATYGRGDEELLGRALARLLDELDRGRARVTFAHQFGRLIEEQLAASARPAAAEPIDARLLALLTSPAPELPGFRPWLERTYGARPASLASLRERLSEVKAPLVLPLQKGRVEELLDRVITSPGLSSSRRGAARGIKAVDTTRGEVSDVLSILLERLDEWDWPAGGVALRGEREHGKSRVHLDEYLLDALLQDHVGLSWGKVLSGWYEESAASASAPLFTPAPEHDEPIEPDPATVERAYRAYLRHALERSLENAADQMSTASLDGSAQRYTEAGGSGSIDRPGRQGALLGLVTSQVRARLALHPGREVWVLQFDLRDCFPGLSHAAILECLRYLEVSPRWLRFVERFLAVPVRTPSGTVRLERGLPLNRMLSWALSELLLLPLDLAVHDETGLRLLRLVDDVFVVAESAAQLERVWSIVGEFTSALGLEVNLAKSGCVGLRGEGEAPRVPASLPQTRPRWGALRLQSDATWQVDEERVEALRAWTVEHVTGASSVLQMASRYNAEMSYLIRNLGVLHHLGEDHLDRVTRPLIALQQNLAGPGQGIAEMIQARAARPDRDGVEARAPIPSPLLYWPVTAGGLGLMQPTLVIEALPGDRAQREPRPGGLTERNWARLWQDISGLRHQPSADPRPWWVRGFIQQSTGWFEYVGELQKTVTLEAPASSSLLDPLIHDFIQRGAQLGGRAQQSLSPYWRHVLHTYGPPLLDSVGTFRFLLTELVPLPLLLGDRASTTDLNGESL